MTEHVRCHYQGLKSLSRHIVIATSVEQSVLRFDSSHDDYDVCVSVRLVRLRAACTLGGLEP